MKKGFLESHERAAASIAPAAHLSQDQPSHPPPPAVPEVQANGQAVQQSANWKQCLELLRSKVDEKKFVGLLLVTKLLPQGDDAAVQDVLDAVGFAFLQRLLLPLQQQQQQQQQQQLDTDKLQQQHLSVVLGLSILSAACRLPDVAGNDDVLQLVPLLLKVAAAGGVAQVLQPTGTAAAAAAAMDHAPVQQGSWADPSAEAAAAADALECIVACASNGSYQQSVVLESSGFQAAVAALQTGLMALDQQRTTSDQQGSTQEQQQPPPQQQQQDGGGSQVAAGLQQVMLSVQLLSLLLGGEAAGATVQLQQDCPQAIAAAVMMLARVFGGALPSSTAAANTTSSSSKGPDLALLQLQAQHALLLMLPLPEDSPAAALLAAAAEDAAVDQQQEHTQGNSHKRVSAAAAVAGDWPGALRQGLRQVMRSRVGVVQRHSALRLAAACLDLLGRTWLLPQQQHAASAAANVATPAEQFLLVLMELLAIETPLLLSDAMNPGAAVPREDVAMAARQPDASSSSASQQQQQQGEASDDNTGLDEQQQEQQQQQQDEALSVHQVLQHVQQQEAQIVQQPAGAAQPAASGQGPPGFQQQQKPKSLQQQLAELQLPSDRAPGPGQQVAGQRAQQCLPSCYQLLEGCLEVLVQQVGLLEQLADIHAPAVSDLSSSEQQPGMVSAGGAGVHSVELSAVLPVLGERQVEQMMQRLHQVTEVLCEFLEHAAPAAVGSDSSSAAIDPLLTVGAVRVIGRFLADAPDAHQEVLHRLLPQLLALRIPGQDQGPAVSSAVCFLLPALLCWTAPSNASQQQWADVLLAPGIGCLQQLVGFAGGAATAAAKLAASLDAAGQLVEGSSSSSSSALDELRSLESQLGTACQVLQQLLTSLPAARAQQQQQSMGRGGLQEEHLQALRVLLQQLGSWAAVRHKQHQQQQEQAVHGRMTVEPAASLAAVFLQALQAVVLELPVVLPAAALAGQLWTLLTATDPEREHGGALLLALGCEAGWSYQLLNMYQQQHPAAWVEASHGSDGLQGLLLQMQDIWLSADLSEMWDACLTAAAELFLEGRCSSLSQMLASSAWVKEAAHAVDATTAGARQQVHAGSVMQMVVQDNAALQLLSRAVAR